MQADAETGNKSLGIFFSGCGQPNAELSQVTGWMEITVVWLASSENQAARSATAHGSQGGSSG
jgi:hypothetical protein